MRSNGKNNTTFTIIYYNIIESGLIFSIDPLLSLKIKEKCKKGQSRQKTLRPLRWAISGPNAMKFGLEIPMCVPHKFYLVILEICPALTPMSSLCLLQYPPYTTLRQNHANFVGNNRFEGFCIDMIREIFDIAGETKLTIMDLDIL